MDNIISLTKEQQDFAEKNHNLIFYFANKNNISLEEYYGDLAIAFCNSVKKYDKNSGFKFSTFVYSAMKNAMLENFRTNNKKSSIPDSNFISFDDNKEVDNCEKLTLYNIIPDKNNEFENFDFYEDLYKSTDFDDEEKYVVKMLISGYSQTEIANKKNVSKQAINKKVSTIRKKIKNIDFTK